MWAPGIPYRCPTDTLRTLLRAGSEQQGMSGSGPTGDVMVAVEDPDQVRQLVRTAGDLARLGSETIRLVTVVVKPYDSPFGIFDDETILREFAADSHELIEQATAPEGVEIVRDLVVGRTVASGLLAAVKKTDPSSLVIGWDADPSRSDALLGTTVDTVLERATTDVYVERIGREANGVESILLPVAGGPHVRASAHIAKAIALANDSPITLLTVEGDPSTEATGEAYIEEARTALKSTTGPIPDIETEAVGGSVSDAIATAADDHDVVVLGATRKGPLRGRLVGSVPRRIVRRTDKTVVIARDGQVAGGFRARLSALLRR